MRPIHILGHYVQFSGERLMISVDGMVIGRKVTVSGKYPMKFQTSRKAFIRGMNWLREHIAFHITHDFINGEWVKRPKQ